MNLEKMFPRSSGVLLHVTSLPGAFGIGDLGAHATAFVDFLHRAGQSVWQVLPLGPPALGNSPYSCYSAFAGNSLLISPEQLAKDGWLKASDIILPGKSNDDKVDFQTAFQNKRSLFKQAFEQSRVVLRSSQPFKQFCDQQASWLDDFARFESLMWHFENANWTKWPAELSQRDEASIKQSESELSDKIEYSKFLQFVFDQQWTRVKGYANEKGIRIFGDMPIFVAHESADVWANQNVFRLDEQGNPTVVAGVPPDYFSETGQLWGNPLYRWDVMEANGYAWWTARFAQAFRQFDMLRVDHFRGFESFWEVPAGAETAMHGCWQPGPGTKPFDAARQQLGELPIIAEDLGMITEQVHELRKRLEFPAMRVMQFGFDDANDIFHHPEHFSENSIAYTGTHDNDTLMGWADQKLQQDSKELLTRMLSGEEAVHLQLINILLQSKSHTAIIPVQDLLGLGSETRMNIPGQAKGNWAWRVQADELTDQLAAKVQSMTDAAQRLL